MDVAKLISGRVGRIGKRYSVSLNLFDTQNARAEKAISEFCRSEDELIELIQRVALKLFEEKIVEPRESIHTKSIGIASGESTVKAYMALKKLEAKCETGISYKDYGPVLGDTKFEVNMFLESSAAKENPELTNSIKVAMDHYEFAMLVWNEMIKRPPNSSFWPQPLWEASLKKYPEVFKDPWMGLIQSNKYDEFLSLIWSKAKAELKKAGEMLAQK
jgi:hypothetical protein